MYLSHNYLQWKTLRENQQCIWYFFPCPGFSSFSYDLFTGFPEPDGYLPVQKPAMNLSSKYCSCLPMSLGFQFLTCFGTKFHRATTSWWRNTTWLSIPSVPKKSRSKESLPTPSFFFFLTETSQNLWLFYDYPFLKHLHFHSISFVKWGQKYTVLKVRTRLNLHCGAILFSVQFSRLSHLISSIWSAFLTATKHQFAFTKLSKASRSSSQIAMLSSQPIPDICGAIPYVYHFMLKLMPEFPLQSVLYSPFEVLVYLHPCYSE